MSGGLLVVSAHPDDEVLIAGGVLAACADAGAETGVLCLTRGEQGPIADPALATRETLPDVREAELRAACRILGVGWVRCARNRDGWLPWDEAGPPAQEIGDAIAELAPRVVITFGQDGLYWHPDHVAACNLTHEAVARAAQADIAHAPTLFESVWPSGAMTGLTTAMTERGLPADLWDLDPAAFGVPDSEHVIEIDVASFIERKVSALRAHATQLGPGNAFTHIPPDIAVTFLGVERFRAAGAGPDDDGWLAATAAAGSARHG